MIEAKDKTTQDSFLGGRVTLSQPARGFRAGSDSVLVAAAVAAKEGDHILDIGAGAGAISLCLIARLQLITVTAVEKQTIYADCLANNAKLNSVEDRLQIKARAIEQVASDLQGRFDHVVMNPPYFEPDTTRSAQAGRAIARHAEPGLLASWLRVARLALKHKGSLTIIYPTEELPGILAGLGTEMGGVEILPLWSKPDRAKQPQTAKRMILRVRRGVKTPLVLHQGLYLRNEDGNPTSEADAILRNGVSLDAALSGQYL